MLKQKIPKGTNGTHFTRGKGGVPARCFLGMWVVLGLGIPRARAPSRAGPPEMNCKPPKHRVAQKVAQK